MKNNTLFHITSGSKIPIFLRSLKQAIFSLRLRSILAGLLMMTLTISIEGVELGDSAGGRSPYSPDLAVNLSVDSGSDSGTSSVSGTNPFIGSGCALETRYDLEGVPWKYAFSDGPPPAEKGAWAGAAISILTGVISPKKREEYKFEYQSTDNQAARFRLLSGSYMALYNDANEPLATVSTSYFNAHTLRSFWTGEYFASAQLQELDSGFRNYISDHAPREYIGLQQRLFGEGLWKDDSQQYFGGLGYKFLDNRLNQGRLGFFIDAAILEAGSQAETAEDDAWQYGIDPALVQGLAQGGTTWEEEIITIGPRWKFKEPPDDSMSTLQGVRDWIDFEESKTEAKWFIASLAFKEKNYLRSGQETNPVVPNDPLFSKEESELKKAASGLAKGLGSIFKLGGGGISVGDSPGESTKPPDQWGLHKVGYTPRSDPQSAWNIEDGSRKNVVVAVIDSGLDLTHPDGPQFLWTNAGEIPDNNIDDDANGYVDDIHGWNFVDENNHLTDDFGHGTFVTGIIAAKTNNGEGIAGINPGAQIMTLKALSKKNRARSLAIYRAIRYAVDNGARVINISLGGKGISRLEQVGVNYAYAQGCLVMISSGNQGGDVAEYGPPGVRRAFAVAAINVDGKRRGSANSGANVALTAPGEHIYSLTAKDGKKDGQITPILGTTYHTLTGTSFSAPMVAATASLIWAKYPHLTNRQVEDMLLDSAEDMDRAGWDRYNGAGLLNAGRALKAPEAERLTVRFTEVFANAEKKKIASLDVYGIVRGNLDSYVVELGKGREPDKWVQVFGPSQESAEFNHICRIENDLLQKGSDWTVRISAKSKSGQTRTASLWIKKK
jgi:subtilisin family serine protease